MADDFSLFTDLGVAPTKGPSKTVDGDSLFAHLGIDRPKGGAVIRDVPGDATPGPHGLMWNKDGGYDPKTGELVMGGQPLDKSSQGFLGGARAFVDGIVNGVPVVGPVIKGGVDRAAAIAAAGGKPSEYPAALKTIQQQSSDAANMHPISSGAGEITGGVGGYALASMIPGAPYVLGATGQSMPWQMVRGAVSNALIGGTDALVRGNDASTGAFIGGVGGGLAAPAGRVVGTVGNKLVSWAGNMMPTGVTVEGQALSRPAANVLTKAINFDDPAAVRAAVTQHGELGTLADSGPSLRGVAQGIMNGEPNPGQAVIERTMRDRAAGASDRVTGELNSSLGPAKDPAIAAREIAAQRNTVNQAYQAVHAGAPSVDVSGVVGDIDKALATATGAQKTALQKIRSTLVAAPPKLDEAGTVIAPEKYVDNSQILHNLRQDIDAVINHGAPGLGVEQGAVSRTQGALKNIRGSLDDTLKSQVPGMAETDAKSAILARAQNAVDRGFNEVLGAKGPHPDTFAADRAARGASENVAENIGIRGRIDRMFGTGTQRDAVTLNKLLAGGEDGYAAANLKTAFGDQPVNSLLSTLKREQTFANTSNKLTEGSQTARNSAAEKWVNAESGAKDYSAASVAGLGMQKAKEWLLDPAIKAIFNQSDAPTRLQMAQVLMAQGQTRDQIYSKLMALGQRNNAFAGAADAANRGLDYGSNALVRSYSAKRRGAETN